MVFASGSSGSPASPRPPAPEALVAARRGPSAVVFAEDAPSPVTRSRAPDTTTLSTLKREPGALTFSASAPTRPSVPPFGAPLAFGSSAPAPRTPGVPVFEKTYHPLHATVLQLAQALGPELVQGNESRLATMAAQLLPLTTPGLESFGARVLDRCYQNTAEATALAKRYTTLDVAKTVEQAVQAHRGGKGLRASLQRWTGPSLAEHRTRIVTARASLASALDELRPLLGRARKDGERLALHLLALRSVEQAIGKSPDPVLAPALRLRLETLRVATVQASLVPAQLVAQEQVSSLQLAECDRLLAVTFSAAALASAQTRV